MSDHLAERSGGTPPARAEASEAAAPSPAEKMPFVEPAVSVPVDVLEATALFQAPTVQTAVVP
ncbi:MAG TPA: hypothetical protein VIP46_05465 [Pyrinomonadaceae bacterium]